MVSTRIPMRLCERASPSACSSHPWMTSCCHGPKAPRQALGAIPLHPACPCPAQHHCLAWHNRHPSRSSMKLGNYGWRKSPTVPPVPAQRGWRAKCQCQTRAASSGDPPASVPTTGMLHASWSLPSPLHHPHPGSSPQLASTMPWHAPQPWAEGVQLPSPAHARASPHGKALCPWLHPAGLFLWSL